MQTSIKDKFYALWSLTLTEVEVPLPKPPTIRHRSMSHSELASRMRNTVSAIALASSWSQIKISVKESTESWSQKANTAQKVHKQVGRYRKQFFVLKRSYSFSHLKSSTWKLDCRPSEWQDKLLISELFEWLFSRVLASQRGRRGSIPGRNSQNSKKNLLRKVAEKYVINVDTVPEISPAPPWTRKISGVSGP